MDGPLGDGLATERYQRLLREADHWRLMKTVTRQQPSRRIQLLVTLAGWLIRGGHFLNDRYQPAPPTLATHGPPEPLR